MSGRESRDSVVFLTTSREGATRGKLANLPLIRQTFRHRFKLWLLQNAAHVACADPAFGLCLVITGIRALIGASAVHGR